MTFPANLQQRWLSCLASLPQDALKDCIAAVSTVADTHDDAMLRSVANEMLAYSFDRQDAKVTQ